MKNLATILAWLFLLILLFACSATDTPPTQSDDAPEPRENDTSSEQDDEWPAFETLASGLNVPWAITKSGDTFYISERAGNIAKVEDGQVERQEVVLAKDVLHEGESGFLGLALAPDFEQSQIAYAYHTYVEDGTPFNRVVELQQTDRGWVESSVLLERIPGARIHNGGRIKIGPDDHLYVTTGDAANEEDAQHLDNLAGKILRMDLNGDIPADNPFPDSYVYTYGHRNSQGLAWNDDGTDMYSAEHGPTGHDEINAIEAGENYGWPVIIGDEEAAGMQPPLFHSGNDTWAPSGLAYHDGKLYAAGLRGMQIRLFDLQERTTDVVFSGEGRLRDIAFIEGELYVLTNNTDGRGDPSETDDRLLKIERLSR